VFLSEQTICFIVRIDTQRDVFDNINKELLVCNFVCFPLPPYLYLVIHKYINRISEDAVNLTGSVFVQERTLHSTHLPTILLRHSRAVSQSGETSVYPDGRTDKEAFTL
jgi:hypothetical protein